MKAVYYERTGPAREVLVYGELPTPQPDPGEVRVHLHWSGVNPSDVKSRGGLRPMSFPRVVPHSDGAGIIDAVGAGVPADRIGERVWVWNGAWGRPFGTAAEYIALPSQQAVTLPDDVDMGAGACFGIPALTAMHALMCRGGVQGKTVLIAGGAGAVGHYAIQGARELGAKRIFATVSSAEKAALAEQAGAHTVINYRSESVVDIVRSATDSGVDRVIEVDIAANGAIDAELVRPGGEIVVYGSGSKEFSLPFLPLIVGNVALQFFIVYNLAPDERARAQSELMRLVAGNRLQHNIARRMSLADTAAAHELVEGGQLLGNVVLSIE